MMLVALALAFVSMSDPDLPYEVGVASVDVTPSSPVRLSGYGGRREESSGVSQPLFAKALAIDDGSGPHLLLNVPTCAVTEDFTESIFARLRDAHGLTRERFVLAVSHTHSAPMLTGALPTLFGTEIPAEHQAAIDRYTERLKEHLVGVALAALESRSPARLEWSLGRVGFAANRRTDGGPVDHDLPVLRALDAEGDVRAVLTSYACHCTTLGGGFNELHGDWAGTAERMIEERHPGATALITIGCGADANPRPRGTLEHVQQHASALAGEVDRLLVHRGLSVAGPLESRFDRIELPFETPPTRAELEARAERDDAIGYHARVQLARLDRGESLRTVMRYPVQSWRFGDALAWVFLGGEVVVDFSRRLKRELDARRLVVTAYSNDVPGYIPSERILEEGGYEGGGAMIYYDQPTRLKPGCEALIIGAVHRQIGADFASPPAERTGGFLPREPVQSLADIELEPGLRLELMAAEPLVIDPVAIDFADDGALFVCEMHDYPLGLDGSDTPGGRVRRLVDSNGDGRLDSATVFLDGLPFPTGVTVCRRGILVCAAPDILYAEDQDGDGRADLREVILTGFATSNYQARVNSLVYGLDGWWYGASGLLGGRVGKPGSEERVDLHGRDFRFRLDGTLEAVAGVTQQGRATDGFGDWLGCDNSTWVWHYPFREAWAERLGSVPAPTMRVSAAAERRLWPANAPLERFNEPAGAGQVTSACGLEIYRSSVLGSDHDGDAFVCEPVHNLVRHFELVPRGATYEAVKLPTGEPRELLASRDPWFRPVQVRTAPDGSLWVVDMYRFVIEHPRWITAEKQAELDLRAGADRGRLYRIVPRGGVTPVGPIGKAEPIELVNRLIESQGARRDRIRELLSERRDPRTRLLLEILVLEGQEPRIRASALAVLDQLDRLRLPPLVEALSDPSPGVRRFAVSLAAKHLEAMPELTRVLRPRFEDEDARVRLEAAAALRSWPDSDAADWILRLLERDAEDPWIRAAALGSATPVLGEVLARASGLPESARVDLIRLAIFEGQVTALPWARDFKSGGEPMSIRLEALHPYRVALEGVADPSAVLAASQEIANAWSTLANDLRTLATRSEAPLEDRAEAVRWLAFDSRSESTSCLLSLVDPKVPSSLQLEAVRALSRAGDERVPAELVGRAGSAAPAVRRAIVSALLERPSWTSAWMQHGNGSSLIGATTPEQRQRLLALEGVGETARDWLEQRPDASRAEVIGRYREAALEGASGRGAHVFDRVCARCHAEDEEGRRVGPDLAAWTGLGREALLEAVFDPNAAVLDEYVGYWVELEDGRILTGRVEDESTNALTLVSTDLERHRIARSSIAALSRTGLSTMPEGLESELTETDFADLLAWLETREGPPKELPGNEPRRVRGDRDGFTLWAKDAEIRGGSVTYEIPTQNVGYWHGEHDRVTWQLDVMEKGRYEVELEYASHPQTAGDRFLLESARGGIRATVESTGSWAQYQRVLLGTLELEAGRQRILVRPDGPPRSALMDLRALRFRRSESD
ncbi:MAG: neutral/alkaline non-lysosomal ceramidase N-terminal domain-containing protein [Planctomycetota bacterium]